MHVGSDVSLMPDQVIHNGREITPNSTQKVIYRKWLDMLKHIDEVTDKNGVDAIFNLGDTVDGANWKERGYGQWTTEIKVQCDTAVDLLRMIPINPDYEYIGVQGSNYHVENNMSSDEYIADKMCGRFGDEYKVTINGRCFHLSHQIGVSNIQAYRTTAIAREMMVSALNKELGKFDVILRGHAHYCVYAGYSNSLGMVLPCWKGRDRYVATKSLAYNPKLGYVLFTVDEDSNIDFDIRAFHLEGKHVMKEVKI